MSKIHLLPQNVVNQIAAGEVVERPASVIKELMENSVDAKATRITVQIKKGGIQSIVVNDNGEGMDEVDANKSLVRHATSKINSLDDLYKISSYGFRGEALATIASVSKLTLETKSENSRTGLIIKSEQGNITETNPTAKNLGTRITIENLFFNVPARKKFLKSESTEKAHIIDTFLNVALANPEIYFELVSDDKVVYNLTSTKGILDRINQVYNFNNNDLIEINFNSQIKIFGYIAHPQICSNVRKTSYIFVNGRSVKDNLVNKAIFQSYQGFIPKDFNPQYFIYISLNPNIVDVNVHPRKLEVKWENPQNIFYIVQSSIKSRLESVLKEETNTKLGFSQNINNIKNNYQKNSKPIGTSQAINFTKSLFQPTNTNTELTLRNNNENAIILDKTYKKATQFLETYILVEYKDKIQLIDQHAAAERITFDKLKSKYDLGNYQLQNLLIPEKLELSSKQLLIIKENISLYKKLGILIEQTAKDEYSVTALPVELSKHNTSDLVLETLNEIEEFSTGGMEANKVTEKILATMACHHSIRGGDDLEEIEIDFLLKELYKTTNPYSCPHGRPIIWELKIEDLEKKFGRSK